MTDFNVFFFKNFGHTAMSLSAEAWAKAEEMIAQGIDHETIALTICE